MARIPGFHPGGPGSIPGVGMALVQVHMVLEQLDTAEVVNTDPSVDMLTIIERSVNASYESKNTRQQLVAS